MPPAPVLPAFAMILALLPVCFEISSLPEPSEAPAGYDAELALCVSVTNAYRASVNRGALTRAAALGPTPPKRRATTQMRAWRTST